MIIRVFIIMAARRIITGSQRALSRNSPRRAVRLPQCGQRGMNTANTAQTDYSNYSSQQNSSYNPQGPVAGNGGNGGNGNNGGYNGYSYSSNPQPPQNEPKKSHGGKKVLLRVAACIGVVALGFGGGLAGTVVASRTGLDRRPGCGPAGPA